MLKWFKKDTKHEPLGGGAVVEFVVDGGYEVRAKLNTTRWAWYVKVYMYDTMVAWEEIDADYNCPERRTFAFLEEFYDRDHLENLVKKQAWLVANRVPDDLWDVTVSASDDFLVTKFTQPFRYCIYPRLECGKVDERFKWKEFYTDYFRIKNPEDFPPEKIKEKWEEWPYPNEYEI